MRNFLLLVNILALTLPFLAAQMQSQDPAAAEVQYQEQQGCREKDGQVFGQKRALPTPVAYVLSRNAHYEPGYFQYIPAVAMSSYVPYQYYVKRLVLRPPVQFSQWQVIPNIPQSVGVPHPAGVPHPYTGPSFFAIPTSENQDKNAIPIANAAVAVEPTPVPALEPVVSTVVSPQASTVVAAADETITVPATSPVVEKH